MKHSELVSLVSDLARPLGYRRKGSIFWKDGAEVTTVVQLQKSRWGPGTYINIGVIPAPHRTSGAPSGPASWGLRQRAERVVSRDEELFRRLIDGENDPVDPSEAENALNWLFDWVEKQLGDAGLVRNAVLETAPDSCVSRLGPVTLAMKEWAKQVNL